VRVPRWCCSAYHPPAKRSSARAASDISGRGNAHKETRTARKRAWSGIIGRKPGRRHALSDFRAVKGRREARTALVFINAPGKAARDGRAARDNKQDLATCWRATDLLLLTSRQAA